MKKHIKHLTIRLICIQVLVFFISPIIFPQTIKGFIKTRLSSEEVGDLLELLGSEESIVKIQEEFFNLAKNNNGVFDPTLRNLFFFINKTERNQGGDRFTNIRLIGGKKGRNVLFGASYVYVWVFVAENFVNENKLKSLSISAKCSSLDWRRPSGEFFLFSIVKGLVGFLGEASLEKEATKDEKEAYKFNLSNLGSSGHTGLYFGQVKIPLEENTINRVTINGFKGFSPQATFGNYSKSWITSSVGLMWTSPEKNDSSKINLDPDDPDPEAPGNETIDNNAKVHDFEPFFYIQGYIKRPRLPGQLFKNKNLVRDLYWKSSLSIMIGTKIDTPLFDDIFVGVCVGHLFLDSLGVVVGVNFRQIGLSEGNLAKRKGRFSLGLTYIF